MDYKVRILNNPTSIRNVSEKLYSVKYQKYMPSTIFTQNISEIKNFFKINKKVILKPIHSYSGNDIHLLSKFNSNTSLDLILDVIGPSSTNQDLIS